MDEENTQDLSADVEAGVKLGGDPAVLDPSPDNETPADDHDIFSADDSQDNGSKEEIPPSPEVPESDYPDEPEPVAASDNQFRMGDTTIQMRPTTDTPPESTNLLIWMGGPHFFTGYYRATGTFHDNRGGGMLMAKAWADLSVLFD